MLWKTGYVNSSFYRQGPTTRSRRAKDDSNPSTEVDESAPAQQSSISTASARKGAAPYNKEDRPKKGPKKSEASSSASNNEDAPNGSKKEQKGRKGKATVEDDEDSETETPKDEKSVERLISDVLVSCSYFLSLILLTIFVSRMASSS